VCGSAVGCREVDGCDRTLDLDLAAVGCHGCQVQAVSAKVDGAQALLFTRGRKDRSAHSWTQRSRAVQALSRQDYFHENFLQD
jgi:hypothetical protein